MHDIAGCGGFRRMMGANRTAPALAQGAYLYLTGMTTKQMHSTKSFVNSLSDNRLLHRDKTRSISKAALSSLARLSTL
jgi:hypothetical protein